MTVPTPEPFDDITDFRKVMEELEIAEPRVRAVPHLWKWEYLRKRLTDAEAFDLNKVHRRAFALCNPGLGGHPNVASTLFTAVSIYHPGDRAPVHRHTPSASRFSLEGTSGFTNVAGEFLRMKRGDLVITPNGEWHDHGNDGSEPVIWVDVLDAPLIEHLNGIMTEWDYYEAPEASNSNEPIKKKTQSVTKPAGYSQKLFNGTGIVPKFAVDRFGRDFTPKYMYPADDVRRAQQALRDEPGSPYEGIIVEYTDPTTGRSVVPTMSFRSQMLRPGERCRPFRTTASTVFVVLDGKGETTVGDQTFEWARNDIFVVPGWFWIQHRNGSETEDAVLYNVTDAPTHEKLGVLRAQGKTADGRIEDIVPWPTY